MILSIDFRTDIPAFYSEWLLNRFEEGFLMFRNPVSPATVHKVILDNEHIEGIIWCSKDYSNILPRLHEITDKFPSVFHYTITGYDGDIEQNVPVSFEMVRTFKEMSKIYGRDKVIWRYDPILLTDTCTKDWHEKNFSLLCDNLHNDTERVVINFVTLYEKVKRHMPELKELTYDDKIEIINKLLSITKAHNIALQTCGNGLQFKDLKGVEVTGCLDMNALRLMNIYPKENRKPSQWGCLCYPNTSIGVYNTCMHKCKYCYASSDFNQCEKNYYINHDVNSPLLIGNLNPEDKVIEMSQKTLNTKQLSLNI